MDLRISERGGARIGILEGDFVVRSTQDALDLMVELRHLHDCGGVVVRREQLAPEFFELKTGLLGEILQKYVNYDFRMAVTGDFLAEKSSSLRDFIRESNRGGRFFFLPDEESALEALFAAQ